MYKYVDVAQNILSKCKRSTIIVKFFMFDLSMADGFDSLNCDHEDWQLT